MSGNARKDDPYYRLVSQATPGTRCKRSLTLINQGPHAMNDLPRIFAEAEISQLAGSWVGCVVDAISEGDYSIGDIARTLVAVAERLHGVQFEVPITVIGPPQIAGEQPVDDPTSDRRRGPHFEVHTGTPPAAKRAVPQDPLVDAIVKLGPNQHVVVKKDRLSRAQINSRIAQAKKHGGGNDLRSYTAFNGDIVVIRQELKKA